MFLSFGGTAACVRLAICLENTVHLVLPPPSLYLFLSLMVALWQTHIFSITFTIWRAPPPAKVVYAMRRRKERTIRGSIHTTTWCLSIFAILNSKASKSRLIEYFFREKQTIQEAVTTELEKWTAIDSTEPDWWVILQIFTNFFLFCINPII